MPQGGEELRLFLHTRDMVQRAIRTWYPDYIIVEPPELTHGDPTARMFAWQTIVNGLANGLNYLALQVMYAPPANYDTVITVAREQVHHAARNLWPRAQFSRIPFLTGISVPEEFEQYRMGALFLAQELAPLCARAFELRAARQRMYLGGMTSVPSLPPNESQPGDDAGGQ